jgi:hypothetical protein
VETEIVDPLSRLIATRSVRPGDVVEVETDGGRLLFYRRQGPAGLVA